MYPGLHHGLLWFKQSGPLVVWVVSARDACGGRTSSTCVGCEEGEGVFIRLNSEFVEYAAHRHRDTCTIDKKANVGPAQEVSVL